MCVQTVTRDKGIMPYLYTRGEEADITAPRTMGGDAHATFKPHGRDARATFDPSGTRRLPPVRIEGSM